MNDILRTSLISYIFSYFLHINPPQEDVIVFIQVSNKTQMSIISLNSTTIKPKPNKKGINPEGSSLLLLHQIEGML